MTLKDLPNLATAARIALAVIVFALLAAAAGLGPFKASPGLAPALIGWALALFGIAALTDFLDGWLARRLDARSALGVMLDPIADKIAIVAAIVGLAALDAPLVAWPGALMLMRELFVAGLRESGMKLPVSQLAKWKTTVQLVALSVAMAAELVPALRPAALPLLWLATGLTLWTGLDYLRRTLASLKP
jgi:CDP-diacylglycerol--glycerol-3-phosphate 3-phosphatidyltransferase